MSRTPESRALALIDPLYAAAEDPGLWNPFFSSLSDELGGAALGMSWMFSGWDLPSEYYGAHVSPEYIPAFERYFPEDLPWPMSDPRVRSRFARGSEVFPDGELPATGFYRDYMQPQGFAAEGAIGHLIATAGGRPVAGLTIYRREGGPPITDDDLAMCNLLVPHLSAAASIRDALRHSHQERDARTEVLDRMPVGVIILDAERRSLVTNRVAREILEARDGLSECDGTLSAARPQDDRKLQSLIEQAVRYDPEHLVGSTPFEGDFLAIRRPSGAPAYALMVTRLFASPKASAVGDEVAAILVANPNPGNPPHTDTFRQLFGLTGAEAEVVSLLAAGHTLEEISEERGVKLTTTRTLLKRVFAKTSTSRQGEIVRLVLTSGVSADDR